MKDIDPQTLLFLKSIIGISKKGKDIQFKDVSIPQNEHGQGKVAKSLQRLCDAGYIYYTTDEQGNKHYYTTEKGKTEIEASRTGKAGFRSGVKHKNFTR
jgi:DNA-binding PadR family transcriptional regulator